MSSEKSYCVLTGKVVQLGDGQLSRILEKGTCINMRSVKRNGVLSVYLCRPVGPQSMKAQVLAHY